MYGRHHIRIARPSKDLTAAEHFWTEGLGMDVLFRREAPPAGGDAEDDGSGDGEPYALLMTGWRDAGWHLELALDPRAPVTPRPAFPSRPGSPAVDLPGRG